MKNVGCCSEMYYCSESKFRRTSHGGGIGARNPLPAPYRRHASPFESNRWSLARSRGGSECICVTPNRFPRPSSPGMPGSIQANIGVEFIGVSWRLKASRTGIESEGPWAERCAGKSP